ncbi:MAG: glycoside hydrolase family 97 protein [Terracidiphilus sp.]|nr:glycoside hydrolase family 97 protein [Terracidiphilus sp.]
MTGFVKYLIAPAFAMALPMLLFSQATAPVLSSPDGQIAMTFSIQPSSTLGTNGSGQLMYSVTFHGKPVIDKSALALELGDSTPLGMSVTMADSKPGSGVDDYALSNTKVSHVHDAYNSLSVTVAEASTSPYSGGRSMIVEARAYNSGIAFRYVLPKQLAIPNLRLRAEGTEFRFSEDDTAWLLTLPGYRSSYESEYVRYELSALSNQGGVASKFLVGMPVLLHQLGVAWISLMEADLEKNSSMYVTNPSGSWMGHYLTVKLSPRWDDPDYAVIGDLPHHSAWRVLGIADEPGRLVEANLQTDLSPANRLQDTSWIHPGKASWNWWSDNVDKNGNSGDKSYNTETMKHYIDFASESGFPYFFLDGGWSGIQDTTKMNGTVDVPELVQYAAKKNVKVWIWLYSESVMRQMKEAFPLYEKWGVAGLKIDFVNRDDQEGIQFFYDVARYGAEHHLMIDFHGCHTPWGLMRTYPNVMSYEAVLGMEQNKAGRRDTPTNRTALAFTRLLTGPMDYTAGAFDNATEASFVARNSSPMAMGTRAQQLALYVIYENPVPMVSDSPQHYKGQAAFQFLKDVPEVWDETRVLNGMPGEYATIARRHGGEWYLGSMTNWDHRTLSIPLQFLGSGTYVAEIYEDGPDAAADPKQVIVRKETVTASSMLTLNLAPGGGAAIRFLPKK